MDRKGRLKIGQSTASSAPIAAVFSFFAKDAPAFVRRKELNWNAEPAYDPE
ncbi:MAG TPA: hypothetical protein VFF30_05430 [Nitrososphaerales archaeon]|nr:hypothetical protein [Nitrososphaerales archaeon]